MNIFSAAEAEPGLAESLNADLLAQIPLGAPDNMSRSRILPHPYTKQIPKPAEFTWRLRNV